jgi:RNA polymerase sigma-70 factor (ECF subfamily)
MQPDEIARQLLDARVEMTGYFRSVIIDRHLAEDVFQDVCVKAIQAHETFDDAKHLRRWCHTVGRNRAIDLLRKKGNKQILLGDTVLAQLEDDENSRQPAGWANSGAKLEALGECLAGLTPRSQKIVALRYGEELTGIEVAKRMDCKIDTLYKSLARIYQNLRICISDKLRPPQP